MDGSVELTVAAAGERSRTWSPLEAGRVFELIRATRDVLLGENSPVVLARLDVDRIEPPRHVRRLRCAPGWMESGCLRITVL